MITIRTNKNSLCSYWSSGIDERESTLKFFLAARSHDVHTERNLVTSAGHDKKPNIFPSGSIFIVYVYVYIYDKFYRRWMLAFLFQKEKAKLRLRTVRLKKKQTRRTSRQMTPLSERGNIDGHIYNIA